MNLYRYLNFLLNFFILIPVVTGQVSDIRVEVGETDLKPGQPFELKVFVKNSQDRSEVVFPNLNGLEKGSTTRLRNLAGSGEIAEPQELIVQQYFFSGEFLDVPSSDVLVDGKSYVVPGFVLKIKIEADDPSAGSSEQGILEIDDPLPDSLEREDVFLTVRPNKTSVYLREGFGAYLSLFVAKDIKLSMEFYNLNKQLNEISKQLRPDGCWEENTWIDEIVPRSINLRGRDYTEYRMFQSVFFPFINKDVHFPSVGLKMNMGDDAQNLKTFFTRPVTVQVKSLPPHPRSDAVAVGNYELIEVLSDNKTSVGMPFTYRFGVSGQGNITAISAPTTIPVQTFEFYPPQMSQSLRADLKTVTGVKNFDYTLVAKQKGTFPLAGYFQWIFFDPVREVYDTLRSEKTIEVAGSKGAVIESVLPLGENRLYANLEQLDSEAIHRNYTGIFRFVTNVVVFLMLLLVLWIFRK